MEVPTSKARGITARLNLMGCVDYSSGEVQYREIDGNTSGEDTKNFIETLAGQSNPDCPTIVFLDRASIHTCSAIHEQRENWKKRGLIVVYLPPYSPELNLMEGEWRQLKYEDLQQRHFDTKEDLRQGVRGANWGMAI